MRKTLLSLKKLHALVRHFFEKVSQNQQTTKRGRPRKYSDTFIITLWLYQTLNKECAKFLLHEKEDKIQFYIADATGFL